MQVMGVTGNGLPRKHTSVITRFAANPEKPAKPKGFFRYEGVSGGKIRGLIGLGILAAVLGPVAAFPERSLDLAIKAAAKMGLGQDDSRIRIASDDNPKVAEAENRYAASLYTLSRQQEAFIHQLPPEILLHFPDSPGAKKQFDRLTELLIKYQSTLNPLRLQLSGENGKRLTPDDILKTDLNRTAPVQAHRRDAFLAYVGTIFNLEREGGAILNRVHSAARLKLAGDAHTVLKDWAQHFDQRFKPTSGSDKDKAAFAEGKRTFLEWMAEGNRYAQLFEKYPLTPEQILDESAFQKPGRFTQEDIDTFADILGWGKEDIRKNKLLFQHDPKEVAYSLFVDNVIDTLISVTQHSPEGLEQSRANVKKKLEKQANALPGRFPYPEWKHKIDLEKLKLYEHRMTIFAPIREARKTAIPEDLRQQIKTYGNVVNQERDKMSDALRDGWHHLTDNLHEDLSRVIFYGRWLNNPYNFSKEADNPNRLLDYWTGRDIVFQH